MPTPSNNSIAAAIARTTCPPEPERISAWRESSDTVSNNYPLDSLSPEIPIAPSMPSQSDGGSTPEPMKAEGKPTGVEEDDPVRATSPAESTCPRSQSPAATPGSSLLNWEFSNVRLLPNHTSFLRSGSKFAGTQQSDRQVYSVDVEIKHVDMAESYLCGYLRIQGM